MAGEREKERVVTLLEFATEAKAPTWVWWTILFLFVAGGFYG